MGFKNIPLLLVIVTAFLFSGCSMIEPIVNIGSAPIHTASDKPTMQNIEQAITQSLSERQFEPKVIKPGLIEGHLLNDKFDVTVEVKYDTHAYSITHKSSTPNLEYDGSNIHRRYNSWILRIDKSIRAHLSRI